MKTTDKEVLLEAIEAQERLQRTNIRWYEGVGENDGKVVIREAHLPVKVKRNISQTPAALLVASLARQSGRSLLVTDYVNPKLAEALRGANQEFMDTAGNIFINQPGCFVLVVGQKNGWNRTGTIVDTNAAFEMAGLKVVYGFLIKPELINSPYRTIAEETGAAVGTVGRVIKGLEVGRIIQKKSNGDRVILKTDELIERWLNAYATKLAPKIDLGTFYIEKKNWTQDFNIQQYQALWGGEPAAAKYTDYLNPHELTLYMPQDSLSIFVKDFRARKMDPFVSETDFQAIRLKEKFWKFKENDYVNPLLVYADLLVTDDARNIETARILYDKFIQSRLE